MYILYYIYIYDCICILYICNGLYLRHRFILLQLLLLLLLLSYQLTIASAYEKGHQRPALSVYTFQAPDQEGNNCCHSQPASPVSSSSSCSSSNQQLSRIQLRRNNGNRPPIPNRCSSLERPSTTVKTEPPSSPRGKPKLPLPAHLAKGFYNFSFYSNT